MGRERNIGKGYRANQFHNRSKFSWRINWINTIRLYVNCGHKNRSDDGCCDAKALRSAVIRARVSQSTISRRGGGGMRWKTFLHRISTRHDDSFKRFQLVVAGLKEAVRFPHGKTHNNNMHNRKSTFRYRFFPSTLILLPSPSLPSCPIYDASLAFSLFAIACKSGRFIVWSDWRTVRRRARRTFLQQCNN